MATNTKRAFFLFAGALVILLFLVFLFPIISGQTNNDTVPSPSVPTEVAQEKERISYSGQSGKDALTLLEETATVEKAPSGFVTDINNRKADEAKNEFWAFYVNGEIASVGPSEYQTKDTDLIEWKIDHY